VGSRELQRIGREHARDCIMPNWRGARDLTPGDAATTDYECGYGVGDILTTVIITARSEGGTSQSGVMFQVAPALKNNPPSAWFDAEWFAPVTPNV
jgi:hypothetical protein